MLLFGENFSIKLFNRSFKKNFFNNIIILFFFFAIWVKNNTNVIEGKDKN